MLNIFTNLNTYNIHIIYIAIQAYIIKYINKY